MSRFAKIRVLAIFTCIGLHVCPFGLAAANASTSVPLRIVNGNILIVSMRVNGRGPYDFVLDTGTNTSLFEPELAAILELHPVDRIALTTLTGSAPLPRYIVDSISIGKADISHVEMLSQALPALHRLDGKVQGILGLNALRDFSFRIDNEHKQLDLFIDEPLPLFFKSKGVAVQVAQDRIVVPVFAEAAIGGLWKLELDSGVSQVIVFGERISGTKRGNTAATRVTTNSPESSAATLRNVNFEVGLARFSNFPVVVFGAKAIPPPPGEDGLLPVSLFRSVFFDRTTSSLFFEAK
jgi:hypothetical protein